MKFTFLKFEAKPLKVLKSFFEDTVPHGYSLSHTLDFQPSVGKATGFPPAIKCNWVQTSFRDNQIVIEFDGDELYQMEGYIKGEGEIELKTFLKNSHHSFLAYYRKAKIHLGINIPDLPPISEIDLQRSYQILAKVLDREL